MKKIILLIALAFTVLSCDKIPIDNSIHANVYCDIGYLKSNTNDSVFTINGYDVIYFNTENVDTLEIITWSKFDLQVDVYRGWILLERRFPELYFNDTIKIIL